jgi:hypothetical protein
MTVQYLEYPLEGGFIHFWLVAGPLERPVEDLERYSSADFKLEIARALYDPALEITGQPAEQDVLRIGDFETRWRYVHCLDDHFVDLSAFYHTTHVLKAWAYAQVASPEEREVTLALTTNGPADLWVNGAHCHRQEHFHHQVPLRVTFQAGLKAGYNEILVRFEEVAARECPYTMALQVVDFADSGGTLRLPTTLDVQRRQVLEQVIEAAYTQQDVFEYRDEISVHWPEDMAGKVTIGTRLQTTTNRIYAEANRKVKAGSVTKLGMPVQMPNGEYRVVVMPEPKEFHEGNMRIQRQIPLRLARGQFSTQPYGTYEERRIEALQEAASQAGASVFPEIANMALGWWKRVDPEVILKVIERINQRADCSDFHLCGLLGMLVRFGDEPSFPQSVRQPLEDCILNFKYWIDEPGSDAMCYTTENHSILFHTCEVLAGQLYPERVFSNNGQTGQWHRQTGEARALAWMTKRAASGFLEWDSNCYFEEDVLALTHLASLAENQEVWEMATVILDKMLFTMAVNSYKGVFGSTHGRAYTQHIKGGYFEATSGIARLAWGMGIFNDKVMGTVALACSDYEVPPMIAAIAADLPEEMWNRERHAGDLLEFAMSGSRGMEVNKVTYKTPDYMLCSAQDWHPGEPGYQQHIWQATFGPRAVAFVNHPKCASEDNSQRPGFWHGNAVLPRVAQWKDVLVSVHDLPEDDWMGFTHAYFPVYAFDAWELRGGWIFGQKGDGYIAMTAARGLELMRRGNNAFRELRSYGARNVWLAQMGRAAQDGTFAEFQQRVLGQPLVFDELAVCYHSLRGQEIAFGWQGPLLVDGVEQPLAGFKHYENPYCTAELADRQMDITFGDEMLRLNFEQVKE